LKKGDANLDNVGGLTAWQQNIGENRSCQKKKKEEGSRDGNHGTSPRYRQKKQKKKKKRK